MDRPPTTKTPAERVLDAAIAVAAYPPRKSGQYITSAQVYWPLIRELRNALDALDVAWRPDSWERTR